MTAAAFRRQDQVGKAAFKAQVTAIKKNKEREKTAKKKAERVAARASAVKAKVNF